MAHTRFSRGLHAPTCGDTLRAVVSVIAIEVNGARHEVPVGTTVRALIDILGLAGPVAVERNREVVTRAQHTSTALEEGDVLEVVHFVGGG